MDKQTFNEKHDQLANERQKAFDDLVKFFYDKLEIEDARMAGSMLIALCSVERRLATLVYCE